MNDEKEELPYFAVTGRILGCCFEVMKELGPGFQEAIYKNALENWNTRGWMDQRFAMNCASKNLSRFNS